MDDKQSNSCSNDNPSSTSSPLPNCLNHSLQSNITIQTHHQRGKCAIYTGSTTLSPGSILLSSLPIATRILGDADARSTRCATCLNRGEKLLRCGGCKNAWYCSKTCQKMDWKENGHVVECRGYQTWKTRFGKESGGGGSGSSLDDLSLLVKTFYKLYCETKNDEENGGGCRVHKMWNGTATPKPHPISCGVAHWNDMDKGAAATSTAENKNDKSDIKEEQNAIAKEVAETINTTKSIKTKITIQNVLSAFQKFTSNNFSIFDELHNTYAAGVYPWAAVLNHSCTPNVLVRYTLSSGKDPPMLSFVACRDIYPGEELCHSYVDLTLDDEGRKKELKNVYGIASCGCKRCGGDGEEVMVSWPVELNPCDYESLESLDPFFWDTQQEEENLEKRRRSKRPMKDLYYTNNEAIDISDIMQCLSEGDQHFKNNNDASELSSLQHALQLHNSKQLPILGPLAYRISCKLLSSLIVHGDYNQALEICKRIVCCQCVAFGGSGGMEYHPLLGLQLFTLADLYEGNGKKEEATKAYRWARRVLKVTHGMQNALVQRLDSILF